MKTFNLRVERITENCAIGFDVHLAGPGGPLVLRVSDAKPFEVGAVVTITVAPETPRHPYNPTDRETIDQRWQM
jgi:hypothetical protein